MVVLPHTVPEGLKVQPREVAIMFVTTQAPAAVQVLVLMTPASEPIVEQPPPTWVHMPLHVVVVPHAAPMGLNVQPREVGVVLVTMQAPVAVHVLALMVPASVPVVEQPPPTWVHIPLHVVVLPHPVPIGLKVHARDVGVVIETVHWPAAVQVLAVMEPLSVPVVEQPPPICAQVPLQVVPLPHAAPIGLKVQPCDVEVGMPVTQVPALSHTRGVVVSICVPMVLQTAPAWLHAPGVVVVPQSRPVGLTAQARDIDCATPVMHALF
jgi:hypothetical protein